MGIYLTACTASSLKICGKSSHFHTQSYQGILSTISLEVPGFPFGSVVALAPDASGKPVLQLSRIAEHTRNIDADARVSLILTEAGDDAQEQGRLTLLGQVRRLAGDDEAAADRFYRRFPHAMEYKRMHDFNL